MSARAGGWLWSGAVDERDADLADLIITMMDAYAFPWEQCYEGRGGYCNRCIRQPVATQRALYCAACLAIVTRERSSRAARAKRKAAAVEPSGRRAEPRTIAHPGIDGGRIAADERWLVLREQYGDLTVYRDLIPLTPRELRAEKVTDEDGLSADDWLAKDGLDE